jgi:inosine-uridine nucleoside N-ribohydrolase
VSFGLDVTTRCPLDAPACRQRFTAKVLKPVQDFAEIWFQSHRQMVFHDPLAAACIFEPGLCTYREGCVSVGLTPPTSGWTVFAEAKTPQADRPHTVAATVDAPRFFDHYFDVVK